MSCYNPWRAFDTGYLTENGKTLYKRERNDVEWIYKPVAPGAKEVYRDIKIYKYVKQPCGECVGCRMDYARTWANRCFYEMQQWQHNYMITLTYDNEHLPINTETGVATLMIKDLQDFMKRLRINHKRKHDAENIRHYACGEYGSKTGRPHYHILAFNLPLFDLKYFFTTENKDKIFLSEEIRNLWGKGNIEVNEVNWNTICYVTRYMLKKQKGAKAKEYYDNLGITAEFNTQSRRPGIGYQYLEDHKDQILKYDYISIKKKDKKKGGYITEHTKPGRYFDKLIEKENEELIKQIKQKRQKVAEENMKLILSKTTLTETEYLAMQERRKIKCIKALQRE